MGWPLDAGRVMTWRRVEPIERVCVQDMEFRGNEGGEETARSRWPLSTRCGATCGTCGRGIPTGPCCCAATTPNTSPNGAVLANPIEVVVGGTGYLTQQIHCLYGKVRDCHHIQRAPPERFYGQRILHGGELSRRRRFSRGLRHPRSVRARPYLCGQFRPAQLRQQRSHLGQQCKAHHSGAAHGLLGHRLRKGQRSYPAGRRRLPHQAPTTV